jgi:Co/Zn/Cd efflux system component
MKGKAQIRSTAGTALFLLFSLVLFVCSVLQGFDASQRIFSDPVIEYPRLCVYVSTCAFLALFAFYLPLSEHHNKIGVLLLPLFLIQLAFPAIDGWRNAQWFQWLALGATAFSTIIMFIPRSTVISRWISPFYVIHIDGPLSY